jgi:hypothetical protein
MEEIKLLEVGKRHHIEADESLDIKEGEYLLKEIWWADGEIIYNFEYPGGLEDILVITFDYYHKLNYWKK